jgi:hypothetical protein
MAQKSAPPEWLVKKSPQDRISNALAAHGAGQFLLLLGCLCLVPNEAIVNLGPGRQAQRGNLRPVPSAECRNDGRLG